ncbi:MAG: M20 family metallo-hydrolase [Porphyromonadaceae bacterium]|nr:M20 family metallo-hydrolase [Porphyromonadaceae bacterium]
MIDPNELFYPAIDLLRRLIAIPSISREESATADLIADYLQENGHAPHRVANNVWAIAEGFTPGRTTILLNSHHDTVQPVEGWKGEAFHAREENGYLYGLGSNDAGASLVSLLHAFLVLASRPQPYNLIFLASAEEEVSGKNGVELALKELPPITFGVVGEPTGMRPAIGEKGLMVLDCRVAGVSGHAARNEGVNAIYEALPVIEEFRKFSFPKVSRLLGPVKLTITQIKAGTQHNVIPDCCEFVVDVRTNELYSNEEVFDLLREAIPCTIIPRSFRLNSSRIDREHPFIQRTTLLGLEPFGSPTLSDQALMPFTTVKIGPGQSTRSHTAGEYIETEEIRQAIDIYTRLLDGLKL